MKAAAGLALAGGWISAGTLHGLSLLAVFLALYGWRDDSAERRWHARSAKLQLTAPRVARPNRIQRLCYRVGQLPWPAQRASLRGPSMDAANCAKRLA